MSVSSPPRVHDAQVDLAACRGLVFVEKPLAVSLDGLARVARERSAVPVVQWRAGRALRALRRAIAHGELGHAPTASLDLAWARDDAYFTARSDWGCGAPGSPLLVPFMGDAIRAYLAGARPGEVPALPDVASTFAAHTAAIARSDRYDARR